jgi:DNA polymerase-1
MTLLAIDGTIWIHALWHAQGDNRSPGQILDTFCGRIGAVAAASKASHALVAFDRRSFRHGLLASYKAGRAVKSPALEQLLADAPAAAATVGLPIYQDGYEADDLLATVAAIAVQRGERAVLCSPDKDLWQCLAVKQVYVLRSFDTARGELLNPGWFTEADLYEWPAKAGETGQPSAKEPFHLRPWQWADFQALVGEAGDNVPGCPGWGDKTSARALAKCGSIEAMVKDPWALPCTSKQQMSLCNWVKSPSGMKVSLACVRLCREVPAVWDALR